ncbi:MAG: hypothetical protein SXG53_21930 [Pseudomonadota bacterium]|nr:hypothetical protein [Pseudomonadota bacterium]
MPALTLQSMLAISCVQRHGAPRIGIYPHEPLVAISVSSVLLATRTECSTRRARQR